MICKTRILILALWTSLAQENILGFEHVKMYPSKIKRIINSFKNKI